MFFDQTILKEISQIAALFASGFKKTKNLCDRLVKNLSIEAKEEKTNYTPTNLSNTPGTFTCSAEEGDNGEHEPETESDSSNLTETISHSVLQDDFSESTSNYLESRRFLVSHNIDVSLERFFRTILKKNIRSDRFKNTWVHHNLTIPNTNKKAWKKISEKQLETIYRNIRSEFTNTLQEQLNLVRKPDFLRERTWEKRKYLLSYTFPEEIWRCKPLKTFLLNNHAELPSLR
jgi:hypothetical protein